MSKLNQKTYFTLPFIGFPKRWVSFFLLSFVVLAELFTSCKSDPYGTEWTDEENLTIYQYLQINQQEYSMFYRLLEKGELLKTLSGYNPYGEDYTLFLPTNEAVDHFITENPDYGNIEEMLQDTGFVKKFVRYHTVNKKLHTDEFPDGALNEKTLTGERLVTGFYKGDNDLLIKVNNVVPIVKSNLDMTNGYIHVVAGILQPVEISGYDWLQQQEGYSILAKAMEFSKIKNRLWFDKYTILAEHDSIYHRNGIMNLEDLLGRVSSGTGSSNNIYQYAAYHILSGEYYTNDLDWGSKEYRTLGNEQVMIHVGLDVKINPGVDTYGIETSETGDSTVIDYIRLMWEDCNNLTGTGPVHSISELLVSEPLP